MRRRLLVLGIVVAVGMIGAGVGASSSAMPSDSPEIACTITPMMPCQNDTECTPFGGQCDTVVGQCVCPNDMGRPGDLGSRFPDAGGEDLATHGSGGGGGGGGGSTTGVPPVTAGNPGPPRNGCSYIPGSAY